MNEKKKEKVSFGINLFSQVQTLDIKHLPPVSEQIDPKAKFDSLNLDLVENTEILVGIQAFCQTFKPFEQKKPVLKKRTMSLMDDYL